MKEEFKKAGNGLLFGLIVGALINILGFLALSFIFWEFIEIEWTIVRGVFIGFGVTIASLNFVIEED